MNLPGNNKEERFRYLFNRYIRGLADDTEKSELSGLEEGMDDQVLDALLKESWINLSPGAPVFSQDESQSILNKILGIRENKMPLHTPFRYLLLKYAAAAILLLTLGSGVFFLFFNEEPGKDIVSETSTSITGDILPGGNKAFLTLADGEKIVLDSISTGIITLQGGIQVVKSGNGQIEYIPGNQDSGDILYNTISTPVGGEYQLNLSDGTKIWLNAASSIRYPVEFKQKERKVYITGEVYFEVNTLLADTKTVDRRKNTVPFIVDINNGQGWVEVLGTHFNISSYPDEDCLKTTLLEGLISFAPGINAGPGTERVSETAAPVRLVPGQEVLLFTDGAVEINSGVDTEKVVAWTKGYFQFSSSSLEEVMKQIARWYDVEVVFEGKVGSRSFGGKIQRDLKLTEVLNILRKNNVDFRLDGRTVYVQS